MIKKHRFRVIFLGDRRIAWEALKLLSSEKFASSFDIRIIVSDEEIYRRYKLSNKADVRFLKNDERRSQEILSIIRDEKADLLLSVQYNWVLPPVILESVNRRAFNLHNAKLPEYKGYNSITHAILNGDVAYESTIHWMDDEVDSGDVAYIGYTDILKDDTARSLYIRTIDSAVGGFDRLLTSLANGEEIPRIPLAKESGVFYSKDSTQSLSDVTDLADKQEIANIARAVFFPPYNMAYFRCCGSKYYILPTLDSDDFFRFGRPVNQPID